MNNGRKHEFPDGESSCYSHSKCKKKKGTLWKLKVLYMQKTLPSLLKKHFKVTPASNNVKYLFGARRHQYLTTGSTIRDGKANYYILPLERTSAVHLLIISQSVSGSAEDCLFVYGSGAFWGCCNWRFPRASTTEAHSPTWDRCAVNKTEITKSVIWLIAGFLEVSPYRKKKNFGHPLKNIFLESNCSAAPF